MKNRRYLQLKGIYVAIVERNNKYWPMVFNGRDAGRNSAASIFRVECRRFICSPVHASFRRHRRRVVDDDPFVSGAHGISGSEKYSINQFRGIYFPVFVRLFPNERLFSGSRILQRRALERGSSDRQLPRTFQDSLARLTPPWNDQFFLLEGSQFHLCRGFNPGH